MDQADERGKAGRESKGRVGPAPQALVLVREREAQGGLKAEIDLLRACLHRVQDMADRAESLDEALRLLGAVGLAATRLAELLKAQQELAAGAGGMHAGAMYGGDINAGAMYGGFSQALTEKVLAKMAHKLSRDTP